jgi:hypothetical protein
MSNSLGPANGSQFQRCAYPDENVAELVRAQQDQATPLNFTDGNLSFGDGTANNYPAALVDGVILSTTDLTARYNSAQRTAMRFPADGVNSYDFPADGNKAILYVVFTNRQTKVTGADNRFHTYNTGVDPFTPVFAGSPTAPVVNASWKGEFGSHNVTGYTGPVEMWLPESLLAELDASGYTENAKLTIVNGRVALGGSTDIDRGSVIRIDSTGAYTKVLCSLYLSGPRVAIA